jgi:hypothetical protein
MSVFDRKRVLIPSRVRRPPREGWSWIDRRFLREHASALGRDAVLLYFFLTAVSDRHGLSCWGDVRIAATLRCSDAAVALARDELVARDLIAFSPPTTQVLALPQARVLQASTGSESIGEILRRLGGKGAP